MRSEKIANVRPPPESMVTVKKCGNITELRYQQCSMGGSIQKWDKDNYIDLKTGEFKEFKHSDVRVSHLENISRSLRNLRDIINTNVTNPDNCQWVTLTYRENMTDTKRLYSDFHNFNKRYQNYLKKNNLPKCEYIAAAEPQGRGAWHLHIIFIFPEFSPFIENDTLAKIWGQGFVKITSLKNVDNIGVYLSAYLGDMEAPKDIDIEKFKENNKFKIVNAVDENGIKGKKAIIKGARLYFYPTGFNIYRHSRGIKRPEIYETTEAEAMQKLGGAVLTYEKTVQLSDDGKVINQINYRHFNDLKKEKKGE
jgi:hypothetical protein